MGTTKHNVRLKATMSYYRRRNRLVCARRSRGVGFFFKTVVGELRKTWRMHVLSLVVPRRAKAMNLDYYYACLGIRHAIVNRLGKTIAPEDFLD